MARRIVLPAGGDWQDGLAAWASALRGGAVTAFATDTVWGVGALASDARAVERIYGLKGRDDRRPMACLVRDAAMARGIAADWPGPVDALARRHWPGALTLVVSAPGRFPAVQRERTTVGLRVPQRPAVLALLDLIGEPLAATSANSSGDPELPDAEAVMRALGPRLDLVVDDARPVGGTASTVVEWAGERWHVLRQGAIALDESLR